MMTFPKMTALFVITLFTAQCASVGARSTPSAPAPQAARAMLAAAERIPAGSRISMQVSSGSRFKAVLLAVDGGHVIVQKRTRLPEPALRVDPATIVYLELDSSREGLGKMLAIGAGIGSGVTLAFLAILAAALGD